MRLSSSKLSVSRMALGVVLLASSCGDDGSSAPFAGYEIAPARGGALQATVGDAFRLSVVERLSDGTTKALASGATVVWSGPPVVTALPIGSTPADSVLPQPGASVTAMWIQNPDHLSAAQVAGVLYLLDAGPAASPSISVTAAVAGGAAPAGQATATIPVAPFPVGDATRGQTLYAANCAACHGAKGEGGSGPGLNSMPDNVAGDDGWTPQLLGLSAQSNMDDQGVSLDLAMPKWLISPGASGQLLTTQNFSDIYAFLKTQP